MHSVTSLHKKFAIDGVASIVNQGEDFPVIQISNHYAEASIALDGAQVLTFQPLGQQPVLWLSSKALLQPGKSQRGGIPVCWPWFSDHPTSKSFPAHGFARNHRWQLSAIEQLKDQSTRVSLKLEANEATQKLWPQAFELELTVLVAAELTLSLTMTNRSDEVCVFTSALHTYLQVGDIREISVSGLEQTAYLDKLRDFNRFTQQDSIRFDGELDRIYQNTSADIIIHDPVLKRQLRIAKSGSHSTVVWNPWIDKSAAMSDFEQDGYLHMLCIEAANAADDRIQLQAGKSHVLKTVISLVG